jgi:hypothetical protein
MRGEVGRVVKLEVAGEVEVEVEGEMGGVGEGGREYVITTRRHLVVA